MDRRYLEPTSIIDSDHRDILEHASRTIGDTVDPLKRAIKLFYAVRDGIWYDPYHPFYLPEHYRASNILRNGRGFCICKASLLCALGRACRIPSRVGFADVRNHLSTRQLLEYIGSDLFLFHGFTEFHLNGKWVKATPAFNLELCRRHRVMPLEFNGREDSVFQAYSEDGKRFMEYVAQRGSYADIPVDEIVAAWKETYGIDRVMGWINDFEKSRGRSSRDFASEEVWKG